MINRTACREVLEFLDAIEGHGYGGMASFESARLHIRIALEMAAQQDEAFRLGDIVEMVEGSPYYHEWRGVRMKVVSLRVGPDGQQWVSTIEGEQRHRGNGVYGGETTDIDASHLRRAEQGSPT